MITTVLLWTFPTTVFPIRAMVQKMLQNCHQFMLLGAHGSGHMGSGWLSAQSFLGWQLVHHKAAAGRTHCLISKLGAPNFLTGESFYSCFCHLFIYEIQYLKCLIFFPVGARVEGGLNLGFKVNLALNPATDPDTFFPEIIFPKMWIVITRASFSSFFKSPASLSVVLNQLL